MKKRLLALGVLTTMTLPLAMVISCGKDLVFHSKTGPKDNSINYVSKAMSGLTKDSASVFAFKHFIESNISIYPHLTKNIVDNITINELSNLEISKDSNISQDKQNAYSEFKNAFTKFCFQNNNNDSILELVKYFNENSQALYSIPRETIGGFRVDREIGDMNYYRDDLFTPRFSSDDTSVLSIQNSSITQKDKKYYNQVSNNVNDLVGERGFVDPSTVPSMSSNSTPDQLATTFNIINQRISGKYVNVDGKFTQIMKYENKLANDFQIIIGGKTYNSINEQLTKALEVNGNDEIKIKYTGTTKYVNSNSEAKGEVLKGKDFYLGFLRKLYTFKTMREASKINGVKINLPSFTKAEKNKLAQSFGSDPNGKFSVDNSQGKKNYSLYNNANAQMFDLYNIDINKTIKENKLTGDDSFVIKFKAGSKPTNNIIKLLRSNSLFSPVPSSNAKFDADNVSDLTWFFKYGNYIKDGDSGVNVSGVWSVAPYVYNKVNWGKNGKTILKINTSSPFFDGISDTTDKIKTVELVQKNQNGDPDSIAISEQERFLDNNSGQVLMNKSSMNRQTKEALSKYQHPYKSISTSAKNATLTWNVNAGSSDDIGFNTLGRRMMYGVDKTSEVSEGKSEVMEHFYHGDGAILRTTIGAAVNWYKSAQSYFPGENLEFYGSLIQEDVPFKNGTVETAFSNNNSFLKPSWMSSYDGLKKQYNDNSDDEQSQWITSKTSEAAKTLDDLAIKYKVSKDGPAVIPISLYNFTDYPPSDSQKIAQMAILNTLNRLSDKVEFILSPSQTFSAWWNTFENNKSLESMNKFDSDYEGPGSIVQLAMTSGNLSGWGYLLKALND